MYKEYYMCTTGLYEMFFRCRLKTACEKQHKDPDCVKVSPFLHIELKLSYICRIQLKYTSILCIYYIYIIYIYMYIYLDPGFMSSFNI